MSTNLSTKPKTKAKKTKGKRGYFYRTGRGWCVSVDGHNSIMLRDEQGEKLLDRKETEAVRESYARWLVRRKAEIAQVSDKDLRTVQWVVEQYLAFVMADAEARGKWGTFTIRAPILFDFCTGLKGSVFARNFRKHQGAGDWLADLAPAEVRANRIHKGYGERLIGTLTVKDIEAWLEKHPGWKNTNAARRAIKRCFNYAADKGHIARNPVKALAGGPTRARETYFTPAQEDALYGACLNQRIPNRPMCVALKVCIRTGMRFGIEFANLTAEHCKLTDDSIVCYFKRGTGKGDKFRKVYITKAGAPEVFGLFVEHLDKHPSGPLFRNMRGDAWTGKALSQAFIGYRDRLEKLGVKFDDDSCMYGCRHTYAKRTLEGYWTGKPARIEELCKLMGNTFAVCYKHYAQWSEDQDEHLKSFA